MVPPRIYNFPQDVTRLGRRRFLQRLSGTAAALAALPLTVEAASVRPARRWERTAAGWADGLLEEETFWAQVNAQFPVREDLVLVNAANLCPSPWTVQQRVFELTRDVDSDASFTNRAKFDALRERARARLAAFLGADPDELALVRNTSEGNNVVIGGLELAAGDEVVIWDQNHPTANVAWDVRARRYGYRVVRVATPERPTSPDDLLRPFLAAFNEHTRALACSHVSNTSGQRLPVERLCAAARERNILSLVDGAQTFGCYPVELHRMGCDFYTGSSHKWFCGPKEVGVLYVRSTLAERLHPLIVGVGWEGAQGAGAKRFETLGQRDDARVAAMEEAVAFHETVGPLRIGERVPLLADAVKEGLRLRAPGVEFTTPLSRELSWGVVVFRLPGLDPATALQALYERGVGCAVMGTNIRFSPHIYNTLADVERAVAAVTELAAGR